MADLAVVFHRLAGREYRKARQWYAGRSAVAEHRFAEGVTRALDRIATSPEAFPRISGERRYVRITRFPYFIVFRRVGSDVIQVIAVAHTSRRPDYWRYRR